MKTILTIAGSDSCAGAGIQADLKTCSALNTYCCTVISAVTAQNPSRVYRVAYVGKDMLESQLEAVLTGIRPDAVKIGMLPNEESVHIVADTIREQQLRKIVYDPVLSATSGGCLAGFSPTDRIKTIEALRYELLPLVDLITPNIPELYAIADVKQPESAEATEDAVKIFFEAFNAVNVLVKGGHSVIKACTDTLYMRVRKGPGRPNAEKYEINGEQIPTPHTHGTGCTLSTAIAANIARGHSMPVSVSNAKRFLEKSLRKGMNADLFAVNGPLIQFDLEHVL